MTYCYIFVLFLSAVAASPRSQLAATDAEKILQELLNSKTVQQVRNEHEHNSHYPHNDGNKRPTNIETINFVFKNNKIVPLGSLGYSLSNRIEKTEKDKSDMLSKLGLRCGGKSERCGCGGKSKRCGCTRTRSDGLCEIDHDHSYDDTAILQVNSDQNIVGIDKYRNNNLNDKKNRVDPIIVNLLDGLENSLLFQSNNQNAHDLNEIDDDNKKTSKNNVDSLIKKLEIVLNNPEKYDDYDENVAHLQCCKNCARKSYSRSSDDDDDRTYLRCCNKCSKNKYSRTDENNRSGRDDEGEDRDRYDDRESRDSEHDVLDQYLQILNRKDRFDDKNVKERTDRDRRHKFDKNSKNRSDREGRNRSDRDRRDKSKSKSLSGAKIFQVNDDLDAIVLDASDIDNVIELLNKGNKYDKANSMTDNIGAVSLGLNEKPWVSKYQQTRLVPSKIQQMKINDMYRRNGKPNEGVYGVPFELDVQGLGQVNP